jgi:hypothetical protein
MKRWRMDYPTPRPVSVECEKKGWPNPDADGKTQYDNTHFDTEKACAEKLLAEAEAAVSLAARRLRDLRELLVATEKDLVEASLVLVAIKEQPRGLA